ncbi:uncharacterized protein LOC123672021 [Harmonia axyridis]|uniref:uncharacterized protein LOC123672021 n=1 Tax=Harmonia axyridis TaxID=115357 RepID=UPI001E276AF8|nr:uncharacterized protein LOC123672021 [Harmonia axyridis]
MQPIQGQRKLIHRCIRSIGCLVRSIRLNTTSARGKWRTYGRFHVARRVLDQQVLGEPMRNFPLCPYQMPSPGGLFGTSISELTDDHFLFQGIENYMEMIRYFYKIQLKILI